MSKNNDLEVLISERDIVIAGEKLTVREYSLRDVFALYEDIETITLALADLISRTGVVEVSDIEPILMQHQPTLSRLMAHSVSRPVNWVDGLPALEGITLLDWWWSVNASFFINAAMRRVIQLTTVQKQKASDSVKSSPHSSEMDTTPSESSTIPSDK